MNEEINWVPKEDAAYLEQIEEKIQNIREEVFDLQDKTNDPHEVSTLDKIFIGAFLVCGFMLFIQEEGTSGSFFFLSIIIILLMAAVVMSLIQTDEARKNQEKITSLNYSLKTWRREKQKIIQKNQLIDEAKNKEEDLDYSGALNIWETLGNREEAKRIRKKIREEEKIRVDQKVVHGDEVTNTEIKDSVVNKSNIGSGGDDKFTKLKELKEMLAEGLISDEEFEKMKKEIIG
tara:strand:- start:5 stop:703 length:699 start_codon:yes stop_codon:yes gene_type:complete